MPVFHKNDNRYFTNNLPKFSIESLKGCISTLLKIPLIISSRALGASKIHYDWYHYRQKFEGRILYPLMVGGLVIYGDWWVFLLYMVMVGVLVI